MVRKAFSLTFVTYEESDPWGMPLALVSLSPIFIMVMYATLIMFRRDLHTIFMVVGQMLNEVINQILKNYFQQVRPGSADRKDYGMPSAHSQFMMFFAVYTMLFVSKRAYIPRFHEKVLVGMGAHVLAMVVCYSRVHLGYHTVEQVAVGSTVGIITAFSWFQFITLAGPKLFAMIARLSIAKFFLIRDTSAVPDIVGCEYEWIKQYHQLLAQDAASNAGKAQNQKRDKRHAELKTE